MITLQMMKGTGPYNQMQRYIADVHKDLTPQQRAGKFTALLKKYVNNQNKWSPEEEKVLTLGIAFVWAGTPEGDGFWSKIYGYSSRPFQQPKVKQEEVVVKEQLAAPALVWPKGFYIYVIVGGYGRFINEEGQMSNGQFSEWANPQNFYKWQQKHPTYKRPETPLPNGRQWEEGYTHANRHNGVWFQFNENGYLWKGRYFPWGHAGRKLEWFARKDTIQRYPDDQPLILDNPPQAPVRPVEAQRANPVGQPVQAENVVVKAPVEAPKAMPEVKKQVGWWK